jgi:hypothetical protein
VTPALMTCPGAAEIARAYPWLVGFRSQV